jgi:2-polyprenyl-3-methyl-5-hydroxy-6-metoxy-1,4-benzoquinol methylase
MKAHMTKRAACRICRQPLEDVFVDLGSSPLANSFLAAEDLGRMEPFYPLKVFVCRHCFLVQLEEFESPRRIFSDYAYFSSFSAAWVEHARRYAAMAIDRFHLAANSKVIEVASNDGYLLQHFRAKQIPVLGIEPAANVAAVAEAAGIPTRVLFLGEETGRKLAAEGQQADLVAGNNVFAHVPELHSFVDGLKAILKPRGTITLEFPHLLRLIRQNQFDTIYHEHFSYLSLLTTERIFGEHGLEVCDIEELPTHGGSLRVYGRHAGADGPVSPSVEELRSIESAAGLDRIDCYRHFEPKVRKVKFDLLEFLIRQARDGKSVAGYGAPAKGNTLLNYCGAGPELLPYTVDRSPHKQGRYLPGTRIPIFPPEHIAETKPDYVLILPWNIRDEIAEQMRCIRDWGGRFVTPIPALEVF